VKRQQGLAITGAKLITMQGEVSRLRRIPDGAHSAGQGNVIDSNVLPGLILQALRSYKVIRLRELRNRRVIFNVRGGADKSVARPERKQATATEDFDFHTSYL